MNQPVAVIRSRTYLRPDVYEYVNPTSFLKNIPGSAERQIRSFHAPDIIVSNSVGAATQGRLLRSEVYYQIKSGSLLQNNKGAAEMRTASFPTPSYVVSNSLAVDSSQKTTPRVSAAIALPDNKSDTGTYENVM